MAEIIVSVAEYRDITCDEATPEATVSARLDEAIDMIGEELDRWLPLDTYTEEVRVVDGHVYPRAVPVQTVISPSGSNAEIEMGGFAVRMGTEVWDPVFNTFGVVGVIDPVTGDVLSSTHIFPLIEYEGGFSHDELPVTLRREIINLTWHLIRTRPSTLTLAGATSASVGDVSVSYKTSTGTSQLDSYMPGLSRRLSRYRRRLGQVSA